MYGKELTTQQARIERMRTDGKSDEYDIRKQVGYFNFNLFFKITRSKS